jgi:4-carboxymuconolactone decarboxylase
MVRPKKAMTAAIIAEVSPKLAQLTADVLFGDVWKRPGLSPRDRSLITISVLTALYRLEQLPNHLGRALDNGVTRDEIAEVITHVAFYGGWPTAASAAGIAREVFAQRKTSGKTQPRKRRGKGSGK